MNNKALYSFNLVFIFYVNPIVMQTKSIKPLSCHQDWPYFQHAGQHDQNDGRQVSVFKIITKCFTSQCQ